MRSNKCVLLSILLILNAASMTSGALVGKYPNPSLGFPDRTQSVANALYSAIELPLITFPFEKIAEETAEMKYKIWKQSRQQVEDTNPDVDFGYKEPKKYEI